MEEIVKKIKLEPSVSLQSDDNDKDIPINKNDFVVVFNFLAKIACQVCFQFYDLLVIFFNYLLICVKYYIFRSMMVLLEVWQSYYLNGVLHY